MAKVLVISEYPLNDAEANKFRELMEQAIQCDPEGYELVSLVPVGLSSLKPKEYKEYAAALLSRINDERFGSVALLGENVTKYVGQKTGFQKSIGSIITPEFCVCPMMILNDLRFVLINSAKLLYGFAQKLEKTVQLATGKYENRIGDTQIVICDTVEKVIEAVELIVAAGIASFDFETTEVDDLKGTYHEDFKATLLSFSFQAGGAYVIPLFHYETPFTDEELTFILDLVRRRIFENPYVDKLAHNANFDLHVLEKYGIRVIGRLDDTMLMHHLINELLPHGLKDLVAMYYPEFAGYDDELDKMDWSKIPLMVLCPYGGMDVDMTIRLKTILESELLEDERSYIIYRNLTMTGFKALFEAECVGMPIDTEFIESKDDEVSEIRKKLVSNLMDYPVMLKFLKYRLKIRTQNELQTLQEKLDAENVMVSDKKAKKKQAFEYEIAELLASGKPEDNKSVVIRRQKILDLVDQKSANQVKYETKIRDLKLGNKIPDNEFNFASPTQLVDLLYHSPVGFKLPPTEKSRFDKTPVYSTKKEILEDIDDDTGFVEDLLLLRTVDKILGTYLRGMLGRLDARNLIHTSFLLNGTKSGRLSSKNPNLQNIPNVAKLKNEEAKKIVSYVKTSFIVPEGYTLVQVDYSQAELRLIAFFAKCLEMLNAYDNDMDLHIITGCVAAKITLEEFWNLSEAEQKAIRSKAKAVNFGLIYGMSAEGFMKYAKVQYGVVLTLKEAVEIRNAFFEKYPELLEYHEEYKGKAYKFGWVRTLFGRRRRTPDIDSPDNKDRSADERVAINSPIQGTAGEMMVFSLGLLKGRVHPSTLLVNTVHDSLLAFVRNDLLHSEVKVLVDTCSNLPIKQYFNVELEGVSMKVDVEISTKNWKQLEEYKAA